MGKYSTVFAALIARLETHQAVGELLDGWTFDSAPSMKVDGQKDFPIVRLWLPELQEGASPILIVDGVLTVNLSVSVSRKVGTVAFLEGVEAVLDAVCKTAAGVIDLSLDGTLVAPMTTSMSEVFALELSLNAQVKITLRPKPIIPGSRSA